MAEVEEKQPEAVNEEQPEKKPKKSRKSTKEAKDSNDAKDEGGEKQRKKKHRNLDNPPIHDMIIEALDVLEERKGVTLYAIKRYLEDNYHVDMTKVAAHVRKVLKNGVENGDIIRTRGVGAMGRFKVKHSKPTMIKKRSAPEDYQQIPYTTRVNKPRKVTPKATTPAKKVQVSKAKTPVSKKGRPGRKRK